jgi:uncharacterized protein (DUF433 family)
MDQQHPRINVDPTVMFGKPVIAGTRIPVQHLLRMLAAGDSHAEILGGYDRLTEEDIAAALRFAADRLGPMREAAE